MRWPFKKGPWTKWTPLSSGDFAEHLYIVFVRANLETGEMEFKEVETAVKAPTFRLEIPTQRVFDSLVAQIDSYGETPYLSVRPKHPKFNILPIDPKNSR